MIPVEEDNKRGLPVVKRSGIGQRFIGALAKPPEQRQVHKTVDGVAVPQFKPGGKPRNELVVHLVVCPGTTTPAGIGDDTGIPEPGDVVRLILRGGGYGDWITAKNEHGALGIGRDIVTLDVEYGQAWSEGAKEIGGKLTTQAECDLVPRATSLGYYGPLAIRHATAEELPWAAKAEAWCIAGKGTEVSEGSADASEDMF